MGCDKVGNIVFLIVARGGSKGLPRKNVKILKGKPLIAWTIEAAKNSKYSGRIVLSSEDEEIISVAKDWGCEVPFVRPLELATDESSSMDTIIHALSKMGDVEHIVLLQPTSPLRTSEDIDRCMDLYFSAGAPSVVSVTEPSKSPYWMYTLNENNRMQPLFQDVQVTRRQDLPTVVALNGAIYVAEVNWLKQNRTFVSEETVAFTMPASRSYDIDTIEDFMFCEMILEKQNKKL